MKGEIQVLKHESPITDGQICSDKRSLGGKPKGAMTSNAPRILWRERLRRKRRRTNSHFSLA